MLRSNPTASTTSTALSLHNSVEGSDPAGDQVSSDKVSSDQGSGTEVAEYRRDALTGAWVIISKERSQRPHDIEEVAQENLGVTCPFCKGNEKIATPALATYFLDGSSVTDRDPFFLSGRRKRNDWQVRVIPNKYPAVDVECGPAAPTDSVRQLFEATPAFGVHEVVIESPEHVTSYGDVTSVQAELTLRAYQDRIKVLSQRPELRYAQVFKNVGAAGGASLEHSHSQIIATTILPSRIASRVARCQDYRARTGRGLVEDLITQERQDGARVVAEVDGIVVLCPFASRFPYEVWLTTIEGPTRFEEIAPAKIRVLSQLLQRVATAFERTLPRPAYNFCLDTAPFDSGLGDSGLAADYRWRLEAFPRVAKAAGFEWATGDFINPTPPEEAAAQLRPFFGSPFA